jgi:uncharacterized protein (TIGR02996 family)
MTDRDSMLRAIAANPDDDTPRLIYADLLDELGGHANAARARFIRLQIETYSHLDRANDADPWEVAGMCPEPNDSFERKRAEAKVLANRYHREWQSELPTWCNPMFGLVRKTPANLFARGFIERVTTKAKTFSLRAMELFESVPVRELELQGGSTRHIPAVFECPALAQLRSLRVCWRNVFDDLAPALAECPWLSELIELDLSDCGLSARGAGILSRSNRLPALRVIRLGRLCADAPGDFLRFASATVAAVRVIATAPRFAFVKELDVRGCGLWEGAFVSLSEEFPDVLFRR